MRTLPFVTMTDLNAAVAAVRGTFEDHGITALPTETFYGLAVRPTDMAGLARLAEFKGRPADKAFPVVGASLTQLEGMVRIPTTWRRRLTEAWPAPVTVVLPAAVELPGSAGTLAVRVPAHHLLRNLLAEVGPLTATSANRSGTPAIADPERLREELSSGLTLLLDGGRTVGGLASTLLDLTVAPPKLLRPGAFAPPEDWGVKDA